MFRNSASRTFFANPQDAMAAYFPESPPILIVLAILICGMMKLVHPIFMKMFKKYDKLNEFVQENTTGIRAVKSFVREGFQTAHFDEASQDIYKVNKRAEKIQPVAPRIPKDEPEGIVTFTSSRI